MTAGAGATRSRPGSGLPAAGSPAILLLLIALAPAWCAAVPAAAERLTFDLVFGESPDGQRPDNLTWSPAGDRLAFTWSDGEGEGLWLLEPGGAPPRLLFRLARLAAGEDAEPSLDALSWGPEGRRLVLLGDGDLFLYEPDDDRLRRLTDTPDAEGHPGLSPDGERLAFIRDFDLHLIDLASGEVTALTADGSEGEILNGVTDWVYWEEIWGRDSTGFWWSPDGSRIAYYRFDESPVPSYPLVDHLPRTPEVAWQRYPKAGEPNPIVRIGVLELANGETTWLDTEAEGESYLARAHWTPEGDRLLVQRLGREQTRLDVLSCGAESGTCAAVLSEEWPTWVNLGDQLTPLAGGEFIWGSERSGWRRLYHHTAEGELRQISPDELVVDSLDDFDEATGRLLVTAWRRGELGAAERQVYRLDLAGGPEHELAATAGWNRVVAAASGSWVHEWSDVDTPPRLAVRDDQGRTIAELPRGEPAFDPAVLPRWKITTIPGPGGALLPAALLVPPDLDPSRKHPAIMYQYGGPGSQVVANRWGSTHRALWHKLVAQLGYVVLSVDNLGSAYFGKAGEDRLHRRFGEVNLAAQLAGVDHLGTLGFVDIARTGLWGWSGGGSNTLYCVLNRPGVWEAAVAGAPVTDWHLYDSIWTERYLDRPQDNPEGYRDSSAITHAARLEDALLVVHGTADDNVHPQNTILLSQQLVAAGAAFEQAIYPGQKHGLRGPASRHFYERMTAFFDRHLQGD